MKDLVLALAKGYSFEQLRPFILSLRATGYRGDVCFYYADLDQRTQESLRDLGVILVPFSERLIWAGRRRVRSASILNSIYGSALGRALPVSSVFAGMVNLFSLRAGGVDHLVKARIAARWLNVYCVRFPLYYSFLAANSGKYRHVMLTDVRDVLFQRDPFAFDVGPNVCCFLEDPRTAIRECPFNSEWVRRGFGEAVLREIGHHVICCSGVTIGSPDAIMRYLEIMTDHLLRLSFQESGSDQGVHNYILYTARVPNARMIENAVSPVLTMGRTVDLPYHVDSDALLRNDAGLTANVLHQYDRHIVAGRAQLGEPAAGGLWRLVESTPDSASRTTAATAALTPPAER